VHDILQTRTTLNLNSSVHRSRVTVQITTLQALAHICALDYRPIK